MAHYDSRPYSHPDRYPPADYPETPYYYGSGPYDTSHQPTDVVSQSKPTGGSRDAYYRDHPARHSNYDNRYDYPHHSNRSREGGHRSDSAGGYNDGPDYYEPRSRRSRHHKERLGREKRAYSPSTSRSPPRRRRSLSDRALSALGLGATATEASSHRDSNRGRSRGREHRNYSYSPSPSRSGRHHRAKSEPKSEQRIAQAVKAALTAGAIEAFRARKEPGDWSGAKGKRVLTAALTAGGTDGLIDRDPSKHSKRHIIESTLAGLATNRVVNGPRSRSRSRRRSRSHGRSTTKDAAIMGILAAAGKEAYDKYQSRSRPRHRSNSRDSYDEYDSRLPRHKKRSKSVSDYINEGIAALGLGDKSEKEDRRDRDDRRRRHRSSRYDDYSDNGRYSSDDDYYRRHPSPPRARHSRDVSRRYTIPSLGARGDHGYGRWDVGSYNSHPDSQFAHDGERDRKQNGSDADNSTDERKRLKKLNRETLWATSIAAAATIHAAHTLTENMEKHKERAKQVKEGDMTREEARRRRIKNQLSEVASVGVAALSIQSAVGEWKNFDAKRRERARLQKECKAMKSRSRSQPRRGQSLNQHQRPPQTVYPDEIEENYSTADSRSRSVGRSPALMV